jgi:DNA-binding HxlR family transcriptional regulator
LHRILHLCDHLSRNRSHQHDWDCSIARSLELVGERGTLLIARDLLPLARARDGSTDGHSIARVRAKKAILAATLRPN